MMWYHWIMILLAVAGVAGAVIYFVRARARANADANFDPADDAAAMRDAYTVPEVPDDGELEMSGYTRTNRRGQTSSSQRYRTRRRSAASRRDYLAGDPRLIVVPQPAQGNGNDAMNLLMAAVAAMQNNTRVPGTPDRTTTTSAAPDQTTARQLAAAQRENERLAAQLERTRARAEELAPAPYVPTPRRETTRGRRKEQGTQPPVVDPAAPQVPPGEPPLCRGCGQRPVTQRADGRWHGFCDQCYHPRGTGRGPQEPRQPAQPSVVPPATSARRDRVDAAMADAIREAGIQPANPTQPPAAPQA